MKATFLIILIFAFAGLGSAGAPVPSTGALLARLDSLLADRSGVEQRKLSRIADLRNKRNTARSDEERYWANDALYGELSTFSADSAMAVINEIWP